VSAIVRYIIAFFRGIMGVFFSYGMWRVELSRAQAKEAREAKEAARRERERGRPHKGRADTVDPRGSKGK
jgi:hypothetical protein